MVPTCKNVTPYSPTPLNVGTMVNAPLCNSMRTEFTYVNPFRVKEFSGEGANHLRSPPVLP